MSLEVAHSKIENLESTISELQTRIQTMERSYNEQRILDELRWKEYNILLPVITQNSEIETTDQLKSTVRTFIVDKLRFSQDRMNEIQFCNIHRLPKRTSAIQSTPDVSSVRSSPIVIKLARITDKLTLVKFSQDARQHNANVTRHLPLSMQKQRASIMKSASRLYKAGRKILGKLKLPITAYMPMVSVFQHKNALRLVVTCKTLSFFASMGTFNSLQTAWL